jgi:hypothetical protein
MYRSNMEQRVRHMKRSMNIEMAMQGRGAMSEYFVINGVYFSNF